MNDERNSFTCYPSKSSVSTSWRMRLAKSQYGSMVSVKIEYMHVLQPYNYFPSLPIGFDDNTYIFGLQRIQIVSFFSFVVVSSVIYVKFITLYWTELVVGS